MAYTIPETIPKKATTGERILFYTLRDYLPEDYIVYYEPNVYGRCPDFVIIGPNLGLVVLEVKDYTKKSLYQLNPEQWTIRTKQGELVTAPCPLKQAREYAFRIANLLKKDHNLVQLEGKYKMQLKFPYGYGTVFTRLTREDLVKEDLVTLLDPKLVLTRDEIDPDSERFSEILLRKKLSEMFAVSFPLQVPLSEEEIKRIRYHLFPEVRISGRVKSVAPYQEQTLLKMDDIETMDLYQENLAKQLGDKHRLIRGVAGSGKTLILAARANLLAKEHPDWKILVLCYNISLSRSIRQLIEQKFQQPENLFDFAVNEQGEMTTISRSNPIIVYNFHEWLRTDLKINESEIPEVLEKLKQGSITLPIYDAILIDEGQDFKPEWLSLVSRLLNPETLSLLIVEDRAQNIYSRRRSFLQDTGLNFRGRSKILTINYRNTAQIVNFSWEFYQEHLGDQRKVSLEGGDEVEIIPPQSTQRKGPEPQIRRFNTLKDEMSYVANQIKKLQEQGEVNYTDILILYRVKQFQGQSIVMLLKRELEKRNIPYYWITENEESKRKFNPQVPAVKISTIDSSKGLDYHTVFVVNIDNLPLPVKESDREQEVARLYIAMTRAKQNLFLSYSGESEFTRYFEKKQQERLEKIASR